MWERSLRSIIADGLCLRRSSQTSIVEGELRDARKPVSLWNDHEAVADLHRVDHTNQRKARSVSMNSRMRFSWKPHNGPCDPGNLCSEPDLYSEPCNGCTKDETYPEDHGRSAKGGAEVLRDKVCSMF